MHFTAFNLFATRAIRGRTIIAFLMATASAIGFWSISTWVPPYLGSVAASAGLSAPLWSSFTRMAYNVGRIARYISLGFLADVFGRKPVTLGILRICAFVYSCPIPVDARPRPAFGVRCGCRVIRLGQMPWMAVWLPVLHPTRMRATGFIFNVLPLLAAAASLMAGKLNVRFGGFGNAATVVAPIYILGLVVGPFLPETRGKALPEAV